MALTIEDQEALQRLGLSPTVHEERGMTCVEIPNFRLPKGFNRPTSTLLLRLNPAFPDVQPDMWWFDPPALRADGIQIPRTEHTEQHLGRSWQRWSRHFNPGQWRSGVDTIESFIAIIRSELKISVQQADTCA